MLNFNQLRVFLHVAKNMSFTAAAKELFITQPAVTAHIKALEESCSLKLFRKQGRRIHLTAEGEALLAHVKKVFEYEKEIENAISNLVEVKEGILRLGTSKTYAKYIMPFLLEPFHRAYPGIRIYLDEGSSNSILHSLKSLKNELAIVARVNDSPDIDTIPLSQEELVLIIPPNHPLVGRESVTIEELADEPVIMREEGSGTRRIVNNLFASHGCTPNIRMETGSAEFVKQVVSRGEGISFLVWEAVAAELKDKKLETLPIQGHTIFLDVSIAHLKNAHLSPAAKAFLKTLEPLVKSKKPIRGIRALLCR